jgi:hypothetical protein
MRECFGGSVARLANLFATSVALVASAMEPPTSPPMSHHCRPLGHCVGGSVAVGASLKPKVVSAPTGASDVSGIRVVDMSLAHFPVRTIRSRSAGEAYAPHISKRSLCPVSAPQTCHESGTLCTQTDMTTVAPLTDRRHGDGVETASQWTVLLQPGLHDLMFARSCVSWRKSIAPHEKRVQQYRGHDSARFPTQREVEPRRN